MTLALVLSGVTGCVLRGAGEAPGPGDEGGLDRVGVVQRAGLGQPEGPLALGQTLELELPWLRGGQRWRLAEARGAVLLLDVWATWCAPCWDALVAWQSLRDRLRDRGLRVVTVSVDADVAAVEPFLRERGLALPVLVDPEAMVSEASLRLRRLPTTLLFDRRGVLRRVDEGFDERTVPGVSAAVEALLAEAADVAGDGAADPAPVPRP